MFSAISESAAASNRRSISIATERASVCDHLDQPQPPRFGGQSLGIARREAEGVDVDLETPLDAGPQHFHRHRPALAVDDDLGAVHLRNRGGGHRRTERREQLAQRLVQGGCDGALGLGLRERRHLVLQRLEIARQRHADHVRPRRQELAELHIGGAEPGQRGGEAIGGDLARRPLDQPGDRYGGARGQRQPRGIDQREHALARADESRVTETGEVDQAGNHNRQPECSATMPPVMRWNATRRKPAERIISAKLSGRGKRRIDSTR